MTDRDRLQGLWRQVRCEIEGRPGADEYGAALTTFEGERFTVRDDDGTVVLEGTFVIDEHTRPRSIDWHDTIGADAGHTLRAIYELSETSFVFVAAFAGMPRPQAFQAGAGQVLRAFVRV